jgi:hypothetical protein
LEEREHPTIWVTAVINGQTVSWINDYWGPSPTADAAPAPPAATPAPVAAQPTVQAAAVPPAMPPTTGNSDQSGVTGDFVRTGYYNAAQQHADGLTFLANYGGIGSGKWTP